MYRNVYKYDEMKRKEHNAVRQNIGWYYFTHHLMEVTGSDAAEFLDWIYTNPIANLKIHHARYTTMLDEQGMIRDDVVIFRMGEEKFWISTLFVDKLEAWLDQHKNDRKVSYRCITKEYDMYAVQGPNAKKMINALAASPVDEQKFFTIYENQIDGIDVLISRAGFSGEKVGYEIYVDPKYSETMETKLRECGEKLGAEEVTDYQIMAVTLPTEKGFYYMRDLMGTNPYEVGLDRGIKYDRDFIGKEALLKIQETGVEREMVGFTVDEDDVYVNSKAMGGPGAPVLLNGKEIGRVHKFTYSYVIEKNIGYALVKKGIVKNGDHVITGHSEAVICDKVFC